MKILFVGYLNEFERSFQRYRSMKAEGHAVDGISMVPVPWRPGIERSSWWEKLRGKLKMPIDRTGANKKIKKAIAKSEYDVVWIEKGNTIKPSVLRAIKKKMPKAVLVSCSEDDMYASHNRSWHYTKGLSLYDVVFTTKKYNCTELKKIGAREVVLFLDAYDEEVHRPMKLTAEERMRYGSEVGFIGTHEEDRAKQVYALAMKGIEVVVWGNGWEKWRGKHNKMVIKNTPLYGEEYVKAINATNINLCFLRKINRDEVTSRSVEIPACGGFMLAERTERHQEIFKEDKEAVFFGTPEELYEKVKYYILHTGAREEIARAGRTRCEQSGYTHRAQLTHMLAQVKVIQDTL